MEEEMIGLVNSGLDSRIGEELEEISWWSMEGEGGLHFVSVGSEMEERDKWTLL